MRRWGVMRVQRRPPAVIVCSSWAGRQGLLMIGWGEAAEASGAAAADNDSDGDVAPPQDQRSFARALAIRVLILTFFSH